MTVKKKLPIGIDSFEKIITEEFYYADKTALIKDLLLNWGEVNLFTRPRRFGKSLNMSMLKCFFEKDCNPNLFDGLEISKEKELCEKYMGQFPVISITLKGADALNYTSACNQLRTIIGTEAERFSFLIESDRLTSNDKEKYRALTHLENGCYTMADIILINSLKTLSMLLAKHYDRKVIILIDEYDVPLDKAFQTGYYDEMLALIRSLLGNALKSNEYLHFSVLTGCLRISKESIFTGLNNMKVHTIADARYDEYFGFTDDDVKALLTCYSLENHFDTVKEWYDGYRFGNVAVYCPWDVINYCDAILGDENRQPENYWANTSGNTMVRRFIDKANQQTKNEIEQLIAGDCVTKSLNMELTYSDLDSSIDNLWSVLFTTGYLTQQGSVDGKQFKLKIPNREIRELFITQIQTWFEETTHTDVSRIEKFCNAFPEGNTQLIEEMMNDYLWSTIGIRDTAVRKNLKENFYHGLLLGLLRYKDNWIIKSNTESGEGYSDILIETPERIGIVIEVKYAEDGSLEKWCTEALGQIERNDYSARLLEDGMKSIIKYGIAFYKKRCQVMSGRE